MKSIRNRLTIFAYRRPILLIMVSFVLLSCLLVFTSSFLAYFVFDTTDFFEGSFGKALFYALEWIIMPDLTIDVRGLPLFYLALTTTILGMILFSGTIIGVVTNAIQNYVESRKTHKGLLKVTQHMLIVNYNSKCPIICYDIFQNNTKTIIAIVSDRDREYIEGELLNVFTKEGKPWLIKNILIKQAPVVNENVLLKMNAAKCDSILILDNDDVTEKGIEMSSTDLENIKIVIMLSKYVKPDVQISVETEDERTVEIIRKFLRENPKINGANILAFSYNRKIAQVTANSLFNSKLITVYENMLSLQGDNIVSIPALDIESFLKERDFGVPIYRDKDHLYLLGDQAERSLKPADLPWSVAPSLTCKKGYKPEHQDIYILGSNRLEEEVVASLSSFIDAGIVTFHQYGFNDRADFVKALTKDDLPKTALLISDDAVEAKYIDQNIFLTLFEINQHVKKHNVKLVVQILNPSNQGILDVFDIEGVVVSNRIISYLASQTLFNHMSYEFLDILFDPNDEGDNTFDIWVDKANRVFDLAEPKRYAHPGEFVLDAYLSSKHKIIPIGLFDHDKLVWFTRLRDTQLLEVNGDTEIIFVTYG
ncbi:MAG: hypothetical protein WC399_02605 [Bacilli bacterium]|jgi:hypothetical protein